MQIKNEKDVNNKVILNLIQNLPRTVVLQDKQPRQAWKTPNQVWGDNTNFMSGLPLTYNGTGFTLIELLVVVLIIGILAAVAVPQYQKAVTKSRYATLKNLTDSIAQAQELHLLTNGAYASDFEELNIDMPGGKLASSSSATYAYNWGTCSLSGAKYGLVFCLNNKSNMEYHIQLKNLDSPDARIGKRCVVRSSLDLSDPRNQICKSETGATGYDSSLAVNGNAHWWYQ